MTKKVFAYLISFSALVGGAALFAHTVQAASSYSILSNSVYLNKSTMSQSKIQSFLEGKKSSLAKYKDKGVNDNKKELASTIIYNAAKSWEINPQVILATLQKEQSLVTNQNPPSYAYKSAMGYRCPDGADCNAAYYGFANQVNIAAYQFRYNYEALKGRSSFVDGDGDRHGVGSFACDNGGSGFYSTSLLPGKTVTFKRNTYVKGTKDRTVKIANEATASFLCYTPHVGPYATTGYSGSDNFIYYFKLWFGSTYGTPDYTSLDTPRWIRAGSSVIKTNLSSGAKTKTTVSKNTDLFYTTKTDLNGKPYLRSKYDTDHGLNYGIPMSSLVEIPYTKLNKSTYKVIEDDGYKYNPRTLKKDTSSDMLESGDYVSVSQQITVNGKTSFRTEYDVENKNDTAIPATNAVSLPFENFKDPRWMTISSNTRKVSIPDGSVIGPTIPAGSELYFNSKIDFNGKTYYRLRDDTLAGNTVVIPSTAVRDANFSSAGSDSGWKSAYSTMKKVDPRNGVSTGDTVKKRDSFYVSEIITVHGIKYYRTAYDKARDTYSAIPVNSAYAPQFRSLDTPRRIKTSHSTNLLDMSSSSLRKVKSVAKGTSIEFDTKIYLDHRWYLRPTARTDSGEMYAIPIDDLKI